MERVVHVYLVALDGGIYGVMATSDPSQMADTSYVTATRNLDLIVDVLRGKNVSVTIVAAPDRVGQIAETLDAAGVSWEA